MYFVVLEAKPKPGSDEYRNCKGAFVSFWVKTDLADEAIRRAKMLLSTSNWLDDKLIAVYPIERKDYSPDNPDVQYFDQALLDDEVCVIYSY